MKINAGDTLTRIALRLNTSVDQLLRLNPEIKDRNKIRAGAELRTGDEFQTKAPQRNTLVEKSDSNPAAAYGHTQYLRKELARLPANDALRPDIEKDLRLLNQAALGKLALPEQTQAVVNDVVRGLGAEERDIVIAKAFELTSEGYSVETQGKTKFSALLTLELSEYVGTGAQPSKPLLDKITALYETGMPFFKEKPHLDQAMAANMILGADRMINSPRAPN